VSVSSFDFSPPKLLISVRDLAEAEIALQGGCDWLDVKEPSAGSLGTPSLEQLAEIASLSTAFAGWSTAAGELQNLTDATWNTILRSFPQLSLIKVGLSGYPNHASALERLKSLKSQQPQATLATVHYADHLIAHSPPWPHTLEIALAIESPVILIDTFSKNGNTLFDHVPLERLQTIRAQLTSLGIGLAVAGSLRAEHVPLIIQKIHPDLVAFRGAACKSGRTSELCADRVALLKRFLQQPHQ
jgi:uncharacterized protein (UPF0264 family)